MSLARARRLKPEEIVEIRFYAGKNIIEPIRYPVAVNHLQAKFSMPALLCMIAIKRRASHHEFMDAFVAGEQMQDLQRRTSVHLDAEIDEHLMKLPNGRYRWRFSVPAAMSYWSELAREVVLPPTGTVTTVVRAKQTSPPYVSDELITGLRERLGSDFTLLDFDCNHMVPYSEPDRVAALARQMLEAR